MNRRLLFLLVIFLFSVPFASAQQTPEEGDAITLQSGRHVNLVSPEVFILQPAKADTQLILIRATRAISGQEREALAGSGLRLISPLGSNAYMALLSPKATPALWNNLVSGAALLLPSYKMDAYVQQKSAAGNQETVAILAGVAKENIPACLAVFAQLGARVLSDRFAAEGFYELSVPANKLEQLAAWHGLLSLERMATPQSLNLEAKAATGAALAGIPISAGGFGLRGQGMAIGVGDDGTGLNHIDTRDRVISFFPYAQAHHGMHVNGTVGGAGIMSDKWTGFAPSALLIDHLFDNVWAQTAAMRAQYGMTVTNNSYGAVAGSCDYAGTYDGYAQALDEVTLDNDDVLHVFAAGNDGTQTCAPFATSFATVLGGYQSAKNILLVGNMDKNFNIHPTSSRGPVKDGRLKPDLVAVGTDVASTINNDNYLYMTGTSMATPNVAGAAALLAQQYKQLNAGANPTSDLLKALLLGGATDLGNAGPDYTFGFGRLNLNRSLAMLNSSSYALNSIANSGQQPFTVNVPAGTAKLKVLLYYNDQPGNALSGAQLVNDLDLEVVTPASITTLPLILNPAFGAVNNNAVPGADHLNNTEQVIINNPASGSYVIRVKGYNVSTATQPYAVAYDMEEAGVSITYPAAGAVTPKKNDSMLIYWEASAGNNPFTLEWRSDPVNPWSIISNTIPAGIRSYTWAVPSANSALCQMRLSRNGTGETFTTGSFSLSDSVKLSVSATSQQCAGSMRIQWLAVPNATAYEILRKTGLDYISVDTVTNLDYTIYNLSLDSFYYMAVRPFLNGLPGQRSMGVRRRPNNGACSLVAYNGNLSLEKILEPKSGRLLTSTELTGNDTLRVLLRNQDNTASSNYSVSYSINADPWVATVFTGAANSIASTGTKIVTVPGLSLAAAGTYTIRVAVTNNALTDPFLGNDSQTVVVRQLQNPALSLAADELQDFESSAAIQILRDTLGFTPDERWDFSNTRDSGRLRTFITPQITIAGNRSVSMDNFISGTPSVNQLRGTYNLSALSAASSDVRLSFDYRLHTPPALQDSNRVYVRGMDTATFLALFDFPLDAVPGEVYHSGSLSVSEALSASAQDFSTSTQVLFGQRDTGVIATMNIGSGLTLDNIRLSMVSNDLSVSAITSPAESACGMSAATPVSIWVRNRSGIAQTNIPVAYQYDMAAPFTGTISTIPAHDSILYTFSQTVDASAPGAHTISVWVSAGGDSFSENDSILNVTIHSLPLISSFPYLQRFEGSDGYFYAAGIHASWSYGAPASIAVPNAASGIKAWKTNHVAQYQNYESSYLYTPCFDVSSLSTPMLSFSLNLDNELCAPGACDYSFVEYSTDGGATWAVLGAAGQGTNWYNTPYNVWANEPATGWHVASIPLPVAASIRFRFGFSTAPGTLRDGIAIDDVHVYDRLLPIYSGATTGPVTATPSGFGFTSFVQGGALLAQINPQGEDIGSTGISFYNQGNNLSALNQYYLPRNFVVNTATTPADSVVARFFVLDSDVDSLLAATSCPACTKPADVYRLGITKYDDPVQANENGTLSDNGGGVYEFYPYQAVSWVPYDNGYYAEVKLPSFSEIWFTNGVFNGGVALPVLVYFTEAVRSTAGQARLSWVSYSDADVAGFEVQSSDNGNVNGWKTIHTEASLHGNTETYSYVDAPDHSKGHTIYYRIRYTLLTGQVMYSVVRRVAFDELSIAHIVYPNPTHDGTFSIVWTGQPGSPLTVSVCDVTGRELTAFSALATGLQTTSLFRLPPVAPGVYLLRCATGNQRFSLPLVVE